MLPNQERAEVGFRFRYSDFKMVRFIILLWGEWEETTLDPKVHWYRFVSGGSVVKNPPASAGDSSSIPGSGRSSGEGNGGPLQCSCLEDPHGQRSLVGYSPWGHKELDTTERLSTHAYASQSESAGCTGVSKIKIELLTSLKRWFFKVLIITQRSLKMQTRESAQLPTCTCARTHTHMQRILEKD